MMRAIVLCLLALAACSRVEAATRLDAGPSADASRSPAAVPTDAGAKPFGAPCIADSECAGAVCFHKRLKLPDSGPEGRGKGDAVEHDGYCSLRCEDDKDCPVPLTKGRCGARGMCKRAE
jgi:hypothetical protein